MQFTDHHSAISFSLSSTIVMLKVQLNRTKDKVAIIQLESTINQIREIQSKNYELSLISKELQSANLCNSDFSKN